MNKKVIQKRLFLTIYTIFITVIFFLAIFMYFFVFRSLEKSELDKIISTTNSTKKNLELVLKLVRNFDETIYSNEKLLNYISTPTENNNKTREFETYLKTIVVSNSFLKGIHLVNKEIFLSSVSGLSASDLHIARVSDSEKFISKVKVDYYKTLYYPEIVSYTAPIYNFDSNENIATLILDLDYDFLDEIFATSIIDNEERVIVSDDQNNIIFKYPANIDFEIERTAQTAPYKTTNNFFIVPESLKYSNWTYTRIIPINDIILKFRGLLTLLILMILVILIISMWITFKFSVIFTKPIIEINNKFKEMKNGNFEIRLDLKRNDEMGELVTSFNDTVYTLKNLFEEKVNDQKRKDELKFEVLQAQINPHFLYNTLDSIRWMAVINNSPNIEQMTSSIIKLLKYNISGESDIVTIQEEVESVKNYINIQKFRYGDSFDIFYEIDERLMNKHIIRFTLQPIVENAFYHAFDLEEERGMITILLYEKEEKIVLEIKDNGKGLIESSVKKSNKLHTGIGVNNIDERVKLHFGKKYGLSMNNNYSKGTSVKISLPYNS